MTKKHHIDQRAHTIATDAGAPEELLSTAQVAEWLGLSTQWLEIGRGKNYGPRFTRLGARSIRYRRCDVAAWLKTRVHTSTAEYSKAEA